MGEVLNDAFAVIEGTLIFRAGNNSREVGVFNWEKVVGGAEGARDFVEL